MRTQAPRVWTPESTHHLPLDAPANHSPTLIVRLQGFVSFFLQASPARAGRRLHHHRLQQRKLLSLSHPRPVEAFGAAQTPERRRGTRGGAAAGRAMGQTFRKLFDRFFGAVEMKVAMLGLDAAGKTTILYKLHLGEVLSTVPTIGFNVEKVQYKNVVFTVWDVGGQEKLRPLWRHYFSSTDALIYVVDSLDRERIGKAKEEFQAIIRDPSMLNCIILIFANKQDMKGAMTPREVSEGLGLLELRNRTWHAQGTCAVSGDGLYEGLDWLVTALKEMQIPGRQLT